MPIHHDRDGHTQNCHKIKGHAIHVTCSLLTTYDSPTLQLDQLVSVFRVLYQPAKRCDLITQLV